MSVFVKISKNKKSNRDALGAKITIKWHCVFTKLTIKIDGGEGSGPVLND